MDDADWAAAAAATEAQRKAKVAHRPADVACSSAWLPGTWALQYATKDKAAEVSATKVRAAHVEAPASIQAAHGVGKGATAGEAPDTFKDSVGE